EMGLARGCAAGSAARSNGIKISRQWRTFVVKCNLGSLYDRLCGRSRGDATARRRIERQKRARMSVPLNLAHRLAPLQNKPASQLLIHEIYRSVQGESTFAGLPCVFVRLTVCNARCTWCDTPHAFTQGHLLSGVEIVKQVQSNHCPLVEITGGEPLLQE